MDEPTPTVSVNSPGAILDVVERCLRARLAPGRSGWSGAAHLARDVQRLYGMPCQTVTVQRALRRLWRQGRIQVFVDARGVAWYRISR